MTDIAQAVVQELVDGLDKASQADVLYMLGVAHTTAERAPDPEDKEIGRRLLEACEAEASKRGVPPEVIEVTKQQANVGRFAEGGT